MARFNVDDYESVQDRILKFWVDHPNGRIVTHVHRSNEDMSSIIVKAEVYVGGPGDDGPYYVTEPTATGLAHEMRVFDSKNSFDVNLTSWVENCETSAIGRALANMGYATSKSRPSLEEMQSAQRKEEYLSQLTPSGLVNDIVSAASERGYAPPDRSAPQQQSGRPKASPNKPPSEAQMKFMKQLAKAKGYQVDPSEIKTSADASAMIDALKKMNDADDDYELYQDPTEGAADF